jgi:hypothetical protein
MNKALTIRLWSNKTTHEDFYFSNEPPKNIQNINWINASIFKDDRMVTVIHKIQNHIEKIKNKRLYAWCEYSPGDKLAYNNTLLRNIMRDNKKISINELESKIRCVCPTVAVPDDIILDLIDFISGFQLISDTLNKKNMLRTLLFDYKIDLSYSYIFNVNPFKATSIDIPKDPIIFSSETENILYDNNVVDNIINIVTKETIETIHSNEHIVNLYFPKELLQSLKHSELSEVDNLVYNQLINLVPETQEKIYHRKLYVSVHPIGQMTTCKLKPIFQNFVLDSICPMIKYRHDNQILYKVDYEALKSIDPQIIRFWTKENVHRLESVVFKIHYGDFFATLILFPLLIYHVKFTFKTKQCDNIAYIEEKICPYINHTLTKIRDMISIIALTQNITIPKLEISMFDKNNTLQVHSTKEINFPQKLPIMKAISSRLTSYKGLFYKVFSNKPDTSNTLRLRYIRCSNYNPLIDIQAHIAILIDKNTKGDIIDIINKTYKISKALVSEIYDELSQKDDLLVFKSKYYEGILIEVTRKTDYDLFVHVRGSKIDSNIISHVASLITVIINNANMIVPSEKKEIPEKVEKMNNTFRIKQALEDDDPFLSNNNDDIDEFGYDDDDIDTDLEEDIYETNDTNETSQPDNEDYYEEVKDDKDLKKYILNRLKRADNELFGFEAKNQNYKSYASSCASNAYRQPIVVTEDWLKEIDKKNPNSYKNKLNAGSTSEKKKKNVYICPQIWCTKSEVPMTIEQFKENKGCPDSEDVAIHFYNDEQKNKDRYVSFLDPSKHPKEFCMPCCFLADHKNKGTGKLNKRLEKCMDGSNKNKDKQDVEESNTKADSYIKGLIFPLEEGRYGRLPIMLSKFFQTTDCSKLTTTPCYVRKGITHNSQYFMSCMVSVLGIPNITTATQLINHISENLKPHEYIPLNNGNLLKVFVDNSILVSEEENFKQFKEWFLNQNEYIDTYSLHNLVNNIQKAKSYNSLDELSKKYVSREFMIMISMQNFINYLYSASIKDHTILLELFSMKYHWLNPLRKNFLILEENKNTSEVNVICMRYADYQYFIDKSNPFCLLVKSQQFYEPICKVSQPNGINISEQTIFSYDESEHIKLIIDSAIQYCSGSIISKNTRIMQKLIAHLATRKQKVSYQVIGTNMKAIAIITDKGIYVPLPDDCHLLRQTKAIYSTDVLNYIKDNPISDVIKLFKDLREKIDGFYDHAVSTDKKHLFVSDDQILVPVSKHNDEKDFLDEHLSNLDIFIGDQIGNDMFNLVNTWNMQQEALQGFLNKIFVSILSKNEVKKEFDFLRAAENPYSYIFRHAKMKELIVKLSNTTPPNSTYLDKVADIFLVRDISMFSTVETIFAQNIAILTQIQVDNGELFKNIQNNLVPFKKVLVGLDDFLEDETIMLDKKTQSQETDIFFAISPIIDVKPVRIYKMLPTYKLGVITDIFLFFENLSKYMNKKKELKASDAKMYCILEAERILKDTENNAIKHALIIKYSKIFNKRTNHDVILSDMSQLTYNPGLYELFLLCEMLALNLIVLGNSKELGILSPAILTFKNPKITRTVVFYIGIEDEEIAVLIQDENKKIVFKDQDFNTVSTQEFYKIFSNTNQN